MKVGITLPLYHSNELHVDFTRQTIESIHSSKHNLALLLIVNFSFPELYPIKADLKFYKLDESINKDPDLLVIDNPKGNHVGAAWNLGIKELFKRDCNYVIIANNDIIFHKDCIDNLVGFAEKHQEFILWTASEWGNFRTIRGNDNEELEDVYHEHPHFSCFMVSNKSVRLLKKAEKNSEEPNPGYFDESFDPGYFEDQDMAHRIYRAGYKAAKTGMAKFYHYGSRTIKCDEELSLKNKRSYEEGRAYFKRKWSYDPHQYCPKKEEDRLKIGYKNPFGKGEKNARK